MQTKLIAYRAAAREVQGIYLRRGIDRWGVLLAAVAAIILALAVSAALTFGRIDRGSGHLFGAASLPVTAATSTVLAGRLAAGRR